MIRCRCIQSRYAIHCAGSAQIRLGRGTARMAPFPIAQSFGYEGDGIALPSREGFSRFRHPVPFLFRRGMRDRVSAKNAVVGTRMAWLSVHSLTAFAPSAASSATISTALAPANCLREAAFNPSPLLIAFCVCRRARYSADHFNVASRSRSG
jgi:hypothetical protein